MKCPYCEHPESKVIDSRVSKNGFRIRRRRECLSCAKRFTTYEKIEEIPFMVVKKDGSRQPFDSQKLLRGLLKACEKRPVSVATLEEIVEEIETKLQERPEKEMKASEIGQFVVRKTQKAGQGGLCPIRFCISRIQGCSGIQGRTRESAEGKVELT